MIAEKDKVVSFEYTLKDASGTVLDTSEGGPPLPYLHGAQNIVPGLESALEGKSAGDELVAVVEPEQGYGIRSDELIDEVAMENFEGLDNLEVGMQLQAETPEGVRIVSVVKVTDEAVTVDANHPLAGETLHFDVKITEVRDATAEELEHGHVHGDGGCDH